MVKSAAGLVPALPAWRGEEGPRWRLTVAPGVLSIGTHDPARAARSHERRNSGEALIGRDRLAAADVLVPERLEAADRFLEDWIGSLPNCRLADAVVESLEALGAACEGLAERSRQIDARGLRSAPRRVRSWSRRSRSRMRRRLAELDYGPLFADPSRLPCMVTLTYPGDWLEVAPSAEVCKRHVDELKRRYLAAWGERMVGVWKREFQRRGAPHYHLFMTPPRGVDARGRRFGVWLSEVWADVVGASTSCECSAGECSTAAVELRGSDGKISGYCSNSERGRHVRAGTGLDYADGMRSADPVRLAVYFAKHGTYGAKEYQNEAPPEWGDASVGRFWGYWGLERAVQVVEVEPDLAARLGRSLRRWQRANGYRVQSPVWRKKYSTTVDITTGEVVTTWRWVRRQSGRRIGSRMRGVRGFAVANDAPALLSQMLGLLEDRPRLAPSERAW